MPVVRLVALSTALFTSAFRSKPLKENSSKFFNIVKRNMRVETDGQSNCIMVHPDEGKHSASIILMHGLGDSGDGFSDIAQNLIKAAPYIKFIVPTAGKRPVTISGGMTMNAWYDITGLTDRAAEECDGIEESVAVIKNLIQKEINSGILSSRIALAGFSQGGAMSLYTGLQLPEDMKPAGILVMSGYLPGASKFKLTSGFEDILVRHLHGTADAVVMFDHAQKTKAHITGKGLINYDVISFKDVGHTVSPDMMKSAVEFVKKVLPDAPELALKPKLPCDMTVKELKDAIRKAGLASDALGFFEKREFVDLLEKYNRTR